MHFFTHVMAFAKKPTRKSMLASLGSSVLYTFFRQSLLSVFVSFVFF